MNIAFRIIRSASAAGLAEEAARLGITPTEDLLATLQFETSLVGGLDGPAAAALAEVMRYAGGAGQRWQVGHQHGALLAGTDAQYTAAMEMLRVAGRGLLADLIDDARRRWREPRGVARCGPLTFEWGRRTYVMGIVNVTPDSFSGDGLGADVDAALAQARRFVAEGADIVDVGGESTRPGHAPVSVEDELARAIPVVERLAADLPVPVSIDTAKAVVAAQALLAGAVMVNDIWGLRRDREMAGVVARAGVPVVLMHNQEGTAYRDLMGDVAATLQESIDLARGAGVAWENIIVDPGFGFGKTAEHNLEFMARLDELKVLGRPILLGPSRKSTIGRVLDLPVDQRLEGTAAMVALGIANGADIVRVHDVREMVRVCRMTDAVVRDGWRASSSD
ncbi:MAG: dihydropteroate synthase [Bacteroidetes bacterium]|nr:dihydropteroate synthase [Bacteroidota bacterium]MCL5025687.1 dihydropteroate synthase [Chloroflexota bacterium]